MYGDILYIERQGEHLVTRDSRLVTQLDLLRGTLDLLILKALSWGPSHGYAVARWIQQATDDALAVGEGSLYPALHRLEEREWITSTWGPSENNRQAKYYALTRRGRARLKIEADNRRGHGAD